MPQFPQDNQDEVYRLLRRSSFDLVYQALEDIATSRGAGKTDVPAVKKALEDHGWTADEFVKGLIHKMKRLDEGK